MNLLLVQQKVFTENKRNDKAVEKCQNKKCSWKINKMIMQLKHVKQKVFTKNKRNDNAVETCNLYNISIGY